MELVMMKKLTVLVCAAAMCMLPAAAEKAVSIDAAVAKTAAGLASKLERGTKVVIIDISAPTEDAAAYVVDQLTYELVRDGSLIVVDRASIGAIKKELNFQMSGEVSDESAQSIGQMLGAEAIVTGSLSEHGAEYRLAIKSVSVQTSAIRYLENTQVVLDARLSALVGKKTGTEAAVAAVGTAAKGVADFSSRVFFSSINPLFGVGSFIQKDFDGGRKVLFWEIASGVVIYWGTSNMDKGEENGEVIAGIGGVMAVATVAYSIVRPWLFQRDPAVARAMDRINVSTPDVQSVAFSLSFDLQ